MPNIYGHKKTNTGLNMIFMLSNTISFFVYNLLSNWSSCFTHRYDDTKNPIAMYPKIKEIPTIKKMAKDIPLTLSWFTSHPNTNFYSKIP